MALIDVDRREIHCKIVYYGPPHAGKTTNLQSIHQHVPVALKSDLVSIATATERTFAFDFLPLDNPQIRSYGVRFYLYAIQGNVLYGHTRVKVLSKADGVVFVADSQRHKLEENSDSLREMARGLRANGIEIKATPIIMQYNKRDLPNILPVGTLDAYLNPMRLPRFESISSDRGAGRDPADPTNGVMTTFSTIKGLVLDKLRREQGESGL